MDVVSSIVGAVSAPFLGEELGKSLPSRVMNALKFQSNHDTLKTELENLTNKRDDVKAELARTEINDDEGRYQYRDEVAVWLKAVEDLEKEVNSILERIDSTGNRFQYCCLGVTMGMEVANKLTQVKQLIGDHGNFPSGPLVVRNNQPIPVEHIPGTPSIVNQSTASKNLSEVLDMLNDDKVRRIGVWGMGGVGKTTLVQNLNNKLEESSSTTTTTRPFSIVIWVIVSQNFDLKGVQTQIANRLNLSVSKDESVASQIYKSLKERSFLLILDDVWKRIDLESLGIPPPEEHNYSGKVIITSRSLEVCREMKTNVDVSVATLSDEESWELFTSKAGEVATLNHIELLAKQITRECKGLPLAIITVGASMRGKKLPEQWANALNTLQKPTAPLNLINGIADDVYKPLKWSYDSLPGMGIKCCFLYCCLYPEDSSIPVHELVHSWLAEGFMDELEENYEASYNWGITLVEKLKDSCLLEYYYGVVKMHDVVRDVAILIACSLEAEVHGFHVQSGVIGLDHIPLRKLSKSSLKRVSFMQNGITSLPDCAAIPLVFPHISTLLLQSNELLKNVAEGFLLGFPALKVLNLSGTSIETLPSTLLLKCSELQALFLGDCQSLVEIPSLRGLINLKMINLSRTKINELPEGMETLTNLRQLVLSFTRRLYKIRAGIISQLKSLEILDMAGSAYKWTASGVVGEGEAASFEELGCLTQLSVLNIRLDVSCLYIDPPRWLSILKTFKFFVGDFPGVYMNINKFNERMVTLVKYFSDTWSLGPLKCATSMTLDSCGGFEQEPENFCFTYLTSLSIGNTHLFEGENKGNHVASRYDLLPNLEKLNLYKVEGINSISYLTGHFGLRLEKLRIIGVRYCSNLEYVLSVGGSGLALDSLEEVYVYDCENVVDLFRCESSSQTSALVDTSALNLKIVKLKHLNRLETLSQPNVSWQRLERLEVYQCGLLKKLPFTAQIANTTIKEIRGQSKWWDQLEDDDTKSNLQPYFCILEIPSWYLN